MREYKIIECPFEIKSISESEKGLFEGYASDYIDKKDDYGDIIMKGAFSETLRKGGRNGGEIPMLWQHKSDIPIGKFEQIKEDGDRLHVVGRLSLGVQKADEAYILMKDKVIKALSIGWDVMRDDDNEPLADAVEIDRKKGIRYLKKIELWEISPVTFPANRRATITAVKGLIENAKDVRELERALCDEGLSVNASKYICGLIKDKLFQKQSSISDKILQSIIDVRGRLNKYNCKPEPNAGESRNDFISRCVSQTMKDNPGMDNSQAVAICYSKWRGK